MNPIFAIVLVLAGFLLCEIVRWAQAEVKRQRVAEVRQMLLTALIEHEKECSECSLHVQAIVAKVMPR